MCRQDYTRTRTKLAWTVIPTTYTVESAESEHSTHAAVAGSTGTCRADAIAVVAASIPRVAASRATNTASDV